MVPVVVMAQPMRVQQQPQPEVAHQTVVQQPSGLHASIGIGGLSVGLGSKVASATGRDLLNGAATLPSLVRSLVRSLSRPLCASRVSLPGPLARGACRDSLHGTQGSGV